MPAEPARTVLRAARNVGLALFWLAQPALADGAVPAVGRWKTIDDSTGAAKGIVRTFVHQGKLMGVVERILDPGHENDKCGKCTGKNKDRPIVGMVILWGLERDGDGWSGGQIFDPQSGSTYRVSVTPESGGRLKVRGYLGISLFGRTQYWYRLKDEKKAK